MPFADDLLEQARHLANREPKRPRQASLRRAVSAAYYALFHLLTTETAKNWKRASDRARIARIFDHAQMRAVCTFVSWLKIREEDEAQAFLLAFLLKR